MQKRCVLVAVLFRDKGARTREKASEQSANYSKPEKARDRVIVLLMHGSESDSAAV